MLSYSDVTILIGSHSITAFVKVLLGMEKCYTGKVIRTLAVEYKFGQQRFSYKRFNEECKIKLYFFFYLFY